MTKPIVKRCAIYTRKSSEEGLEQEFNSLHAQREACEAYIRSQKHEGWKLVDTEYDDGGISGGTMARPALQKLLADIRENKIDIIIVYKVDRLTRSLGDFVRMVELFDSHNVSFVSVTQQFNTTSSMGRLTLNVLLSFAQFEREVTGERIRDKVAASKKKGMWMGGTVPIGYDAKDRKLVVNPAEADNIRLIYDRYLKLGCVRLLQEELVSQNIRSKSGATFMSRGALYQLLSNPLYAGKVRHKEACYPGMHDAIIGQGTWDAVQASLSNNSVNYQKRIGKTTPSLLVGKLFDASGAKLTPTHANKNGVRYRYYISQNLKTGTKEEHKDGWRLPARETEQMVIAAAKNMLDDRSSVSDALQQSGIPTSSIPEVIKKITTVNKQLGSEADAEILPVLIDRVILRPDGIRVTLSLASFIDNHAAPMTRDIPMQMKRRGIETRLIMGEIIVTKADPSLVKAIKRAHRWFEELSSGKTLSITAIAKREGIDKGYVSHLINLAFLAPDIIEAILTGRQPADLTVHHLIKRIALPYCWAEQRRVLGLS